MNFTVGVLIRRVLFGDFATIRLLTPQGMRFFNVKTSEKSSWQSRLDVASLLEVGFVGSKVIKIRVIKEGLTPERVRQKERNLALALTVTLLKKAESYLSEDEFQFLVSNFLPGDVREFIDWFTLRSVGMLACENCGAGPPLYFEDRKVLCGRCATDKTLLLHDGRTLTFEGGMRFWSEKISLDFYRFFSSLFPYSPRTSLTDLLPRME